MMVLKGNLQWILLSSVLLFEACKSEFLQEVGLCPKSFYQLEDKTEKFVTCCPCQSCSNALLTVFLQPKSKCVQDDRSKACSQYDTSKCCKLSDCYALLGQPMDSTELCKLNCDRNAVCDVNNRLVSCRCKTGYKGSGRKCKKVKSQSNRKSNMQSPSPNKISLESITDESPVIANKKLPVLFIIIGAIVVLLLAIFCFLVCIGGKKKKVKRFGRSTGTDTLSSRSSEEIFTVSSEGEIPLNCSPTRSSEGRPDFSSEDARSLLSETPPLPRDVLEGRPQPPQHSTTYNNARRDLYNINVTGSYSVIHIACQPHGQENQVGLPGDIPRNNQQPPYQPNYGEEDLPPPKYDMDSSNSSMQEDSTCSFKTSRMTNDTIRLGQTHPVSNRNNTDEMVTNQSSYSGNRQRQSTSDEECLSSSLDIYRPPS